MPHPSSQINEVKLFALTENASAVNRTETFNTILNVSELILRYVTDSFFCSIRKSLKLFINKRMQNVFL